MKLTWITQAGFLLEWDNFKVMIDPYLSDHCGELNPASKRRIPVDEKYLAIKPDVIITTHDHLDHFDEQTLDSVLPEKGSIPFLGSFCAWQKAKANYGGRCNPVMMRPGTVWTENGISFEAVPAEHSDLSAIGIIIRDGKNVLYFSGDTLCNKNVISSLPADIDIAVLPVNGKGNNMNAADASYFADMISAKKVIPVHVGLFDDMKPQIFKNKKAMYLEEYKAVEI